MAPTISRGQYWRLRLARWPAPPAGTASPGYTLLVPVPGDLPVFLELALSVCRLLAADHRVATYVIPDRMTPDMVAVVEQHRPSWDGPLELINLPAPERWFLHHLRSGSRNHGLQLVAGVTAARSSHIILHDADLFILRRELLDEQYRRCLDDGQACLGVSPVWDGWYAEHGLDLAATWEMVADVDWLRSFSPYEQIGHDGELFGERHAFDTTLHPQAVTDPTRIAHIDRDADYVHFNYVISTYRAYQRQPNGFVDGEFRLLLIALFIELFGKVGGSTGAPTLGDLTAALDHPSDGVRYPTPEEGAGRYQTFRAKLDRAVSGPYLSDSDGERARRALAPFDLRFGYEGLGASQ